MHASAPLTPDASERAPSNCIDLARYPVDDLDSPAGRALLARCRAMMRDTGACELPGFITADALPRMAEESRQMMHKAHAFRGLVTPYLEVPDMTLPPEHVRRQFGRTATEVIAGDLVPPDHLTRRLYAWDPLMEFIGAVLGHARLYRYACEMAALNVVGMKAGDELCWHFDQCDFVTSLAIVAPEAGGEFVYVPHLRSATDENEAAVLDILHAKDRRGTLVAMTPGTLLIFAGRHSLHRVMPIEGDTTRIVALFSHDTKPGTAPSPIAKLVRYGRA